MRIMRTISIRRFFFQNMIYVGLLPVILLGIAGMILPVRIFREEITRNDMTQAQLIGDLISRSLEAPLQDLEKAAILLEGGLTKEYDYGLSVMQATAQTQESIASLQIASNEGEVLLLYPEDLYRRGTDISGARYFQEVMETGRHYWSPSYISEAADYPMTSLTIPLRNGTLTAFLSLQMIEAIGDDYEHFGSNLMITVTDQHGVYIVHPDENKVLLREYDPHFPENRDAWEGDGLVRTIERGDVKYIVHIIFLEDAGWMVALSRPMKELNSSFRAIYLSLIFVISFVLLLSVGLGLRVTSWFRTPMEKFVRAAGEIAGGNYDLNMPEAGFTELGQLSEAFHKMVVRVRAREEELRETGSYILDIIDSMPSVLVGVDVELNVTLWNRQAERRSGSLRQEALGRPISSVLPGYKSEEEKILTAIRSGREVFDPKRKTLIDEQVVYEDILIFPLTGANRRGAVIRISDVTIQINMEEMLVQNEKMLSVGGLAAGMAHEINNPLAGLMQTLNVMSSRLSAGAELKANAQAADTAGLDLKALEAYMELRTIPRMVADVLGSGNRIAHIVDNMLSFARKDDASLSLCEVAELLDSSVDLASTDYDIKKNFDFKQIKIFRDYGEDVPKVSCERGKIQQVFLNILSNGAQAMQELKNGDHEFHLKTSWRKMRDEVVIEIGNNGPGIGPEVRKRIFEPFYTTKSVGKGTGLGLSVSYFIITENHDGTMIVESDGVQGVNFIITLPVKGLIGKE